jgi:cob(I)alamin adenosyltransferase
MKIYTKTGDRGTTSLLGGKRVSKTDPRICALGDLDELNAWLGVLKTLPKSRLLRRPSTSLRVPRNDKNILEQTQNDIFLICAEIADARPSKAQRISEKNVKVLEKHIDELEKKLPPLRKFVIPGENPFSAYAHLARTVCRRAERTIVALKPKNVNIIPYLNRLSDLLFILARTK